MPILRTSAGGRWAAALAAVALTACSGYGTAQAPVAPAPLAQSREAQPPQVGSEGSALCNAQAAQFAVGQNSTATVMESARARSGAQMARVLRPGQMITKEFDAQRLNLQVDANGRILAATCG